MARRQPLSEETAASAQAALEDLINPNKRSIAFTDMSDESKARFARTTIKPLVCAIKESTGLHSFPAEEGWDMNKLEGIVTGVRRYDR